MNYNFDEIKKGSGKELLEQQNQKTMTIYRLLTWFVILGTVAIIIIESFKLV